MTDLQKFITDNIERLPEFTLEALKISIERSINEENNKYYVVIKIDTDDDFILCIDGYEEKHYDETSRYVNDDEDIKKLIESIDFKHQKGNAAFQWYQEGLKKELPKFWRNFNDPKLSLAEIEIKGGNHYFELTVYKTKTKD
jgi:hypothetical protein